MAKLPSITFYPGDWLRDNVSGCSLAAQGLWLRMMMVMHDSAPYGYLAVNGSPIPSALVAAKTGCQSLGQYETLLAELDCAGVPSRTPKGIIYSRRMVRDAKQRLEKRVEWRQEKREQRKSNPVIANVRDLSGQCPPVSSSSSSSSSHKQPPLPPKGGSPRRCHKCGQKWRVCLCAMAPKGVSQ